jgi:FHS family glucose/mannose:H+ symporter-like MFS transporter
MVIPIENRTGRLPPRGATIALLLVGFVVTGVVATLLGPILPILIARWSMSDARAGLFFTLQFCGSMAGVFSLGALLSWLGYRLTLFLGFICMSLGIAALISGGEAVGMISTALIGYGLGLVLSSTNLWVAEVAGSRRASALSVLNLAWGIGAVACPALVMLAQRTSRLFTLLLGIAALSGFVALALATLDLEPSVQANEDSAAPLWQAEGRRTAIALGGLFFLYVGTEACVGGWIAALAKRLATMPGDLWALAPLFFWAGLLAGRALAPVALLRLSEATLLAGGLILAALGTGALWWATTFRDAALSVAASGLGLACIYPLLVARMVEYYGERARRTGSVMFALAGLGGATMPWLVGLTSAQAGSLRTGLLVPLAGCLAMLSLLPLARVGLPSGQEKLR